MCNHLDLIFELESVRQDLDMVQTWIDNARTAAPTNQVVQAELDRRQVELDHKRTKVDIAMTYMRMTN